MKIFSSQNNVMLRIRARNIFYNLLKQNIIGIPEFNKKYLAPFIIYQCPKDNLKNNLFLTEKINSITFVFDKVISFNYSSFALEKWNDNQYACYFDYSPNALSQMISFPITPLEYNKIEKFLKTQDKQETPQDKQETPFARTVINSIMELQIE